MWIGGVRVLLTDEDNRLLMVRQHHEGRDIWMVPGGAIEEGETSIDAAKREMLEETGIEIEVSGFAWHIEEVSEERGQRFVNYMIGKKVRGELILGSDPELGDAQVMREVRFMSRDEISKLEYVHPDFLNDEVWEILKEETNGTTHYKLR